MLAMQKLAAELKIWIPTSFFEADGPHHYNSLAMIGPDGKVAGSLPQEPHPRRPRLRGEILLPAGQYRLQGLERAAERSTLGVGVCWDQWYPETARAMMLMGADILFYPTAIGTEPHDPDLDTSRLWRRAMIGHAVSNVVPVVAANRIGTECGQRFYGHSFICDERGDMLAEFGAEETGVLVATLDLAAGQDATAPPSASSATAGPSFTAGSPKTFDGCCGAGQAAAPQPAARRSRACRRFPPRVG